MIIAKLCVSRMNRVRGKLPDALVCLIAMSFTRVIEETVEPTLNAATFRRIRADIINCRLMPNERLRVEALRERYSVGGSPIREALMRLEAEGLVELEQNKGFRVSSVSPEQLIDVMRVRREIEALALRWSIEKGDVEWEANLLGAFHRLSRQSKIDADGGTIDPTGQGTSRLPRGASRGLRITDSLEHPRRTIRPGRALRGPVGPVAVHSAQ